jgi:hypothetical protein
MDKQILGADAEAVLNNLAFKRATEAIETTIIGKLKECPIDGKPETDRRRLELTLSLKMADYYKAALREMVTTGKLEENRFDPEKKKRFSVL